MNNNNQTSEKKHTDPVCGMEVTESGAAGKYEYKDKTYYFCGPGCMHSFKKEPEKYLDPKYKPSM